MDWDLQDNPFSSGISLLMYLLMVTEKLTVTDSHSKDGVASLVWWLGGCHVFQVPSSVNRNLRSA